MFSKNYGLYGKCIEMYEIISGLKDILEKNVYLIFSVVKVVIEPTVV